MKNATLVASVTAIALTAAPMAALAAPAELTGTITDRFENRVVVETGDGRILVEIGDTDGPATEVGARVTVTGDLDGSTLRDADLRPAPEGAQPPAPAAGQPPADRPEPPRPAGADSAGLPADLAGLDLRDLRTERKSDGEVEYRALLPEGARFEAEYDSRGRLEEVKTEPRSALPRPYLDRILPRPVLDRIADFDVDRIHEVEFDDDDGRIEVKGHAGQSPVEIELSATGELIEYERKGGPRGDRAEGRPFDLPRPEIERIARDAGYSDIERVETHGRHADVWAMNANAEPVRIRIDMAGEVTREERR